MAISRGFSPGSVDALADIGVETRSGIVCDLEFNVDQKRFGFVVVGVNGTKKLNCFAQLSSLTFPSGGSREIVSVFVLKISYFLIELSMAPDIQGMGFRPLTPTSHRFSPMTPPPPPPPLYTNHDTCTYKTTSHTLNVMI